MTRQERADVATLRDLVSKRDLMWIMRQLMQIVTDDRKAQARAIKGGAR